MARSQPDDSEPDAEERPNVAKLLLEQESEIRDAEPRVNRMLEQVHGCLENSLADCPPPDHLDRQETQKVWRRPEGMREDEDIEGTGEEEEHIEVDQGQHSDLAGSSDTAVQRASTPSLLQHPVETVSEHAKSKNSRFGDTSDLLNFRLSSAE